jgi:hypothetical protein
VLLLVIHKIGVISFQYRYFDRRARRYHTLQFLARQILPQQRLVVPLLALKFLFQHVHFHSGLFHYFLLFFLDGTRRAFLCGFVHD